MVKIRILIFVGVPDVVERSRAVVVNMACPEGMGGRGREEASEQQRAPARQSYGIRVLS